MHPIQPTPLSTLVTQSDLELAVVSDILGIGLGGLNNLLSGRKETPPGVLEEMKQVVKDIQYWQQVFTNFTAQGGKLPHLQVLKIALYNVANS